MKLILQLIAFLNLGFSIYSVCKGDYTQATYFLVWYHVLNISSSEEV